MDSPFYFSNLKEPNGDLLCQEVITYSKRDNCIVKTTVKRNFFGDDYVDSSTTEIIAKLDG